MLEKQATTRVPYHTCRDEQSQRGVCVYKKIFKRKNIFELDSNKELYAWN